MAERLWPNLPEPWRTHFEDRVLALVRFRAERPILTPRQRAAVLLTAAVGMTHERAAELLGVSPSTLKTTLRRARRKVHEMFEELIAEEVNAVGQEWGDYLVAEGLLLGVALAHEHEHEALRTVRVRLEAPEHLFS